LPRELTSISRTTTPPLAACARGVGQIERVYHPDRLQHPMRRTGPRGTGQYERISWDEALDEVAALWPRWSEDTPAHRALGAAELGALIDRKIDLEGAVLKGTIATRQFAKRQRTWFRSNMRDWHRVAAEEPPGPAAEALLSAAG